MAIRTEAKLVIAPLLPHSTAYQRRKRASRPSPKPLLPFPQRFSRHRDFSWTRASEWGPVDRRGGETPKCHRYVWQRLPALNSRTRLRTETPLRPPLQRVRRFSLGVGSDGDDCALQRHKRVKTETRKICAKSRSKC
eukprot:scaffold1798_cov248-Pinguiococcus_pyrenoidosus.AAC.10